MKSIFILLLFALPGLCQSPDGDRIARLRKELAEVQGLLLAPPPEVSLKYVEFLKAPETGIVKLFPRGKLNDLMTGHMEGGAYYSFIRRSHEYGQGNDIELDEQGLFRVGFAGGDYGFFASLGRGDLESVQQNHEPPPWLPSNARKLWDDTWGYLPPADALELRKEYQRVQPQSHALPRDGMVYLLRSVSPRRSDILVAFKVEKILNDGGVVIAWRLLNSWPPPKL